MNFATREARVFYVACVAYAAEVAAHNAQVIHAPEVPLACPLGYAPWSALTEGEKLPYATIVSDLLARERDQTPAKNAPLFVFFAVAKLILGVTRHGG